MTRFERSILFVGLPCGLVGVCLLFYGAFLLFVHVARGRQEEVDAIQSFTRAVQVLVAGGVLTLAACIFVCIDRRRTRKIR